MRCCVVSWFGQNVRQSDDALLPPPGRCGWRLSGRAGAAAQLALVVAAASLLDERSPEHDPGHPHERNRNSEPEGQACGPAPGNRQSDPQGEHRSDDRSTPPHGPWKCVLPRCASPVELQTLEASVGSNAHAAQRADRRPGTTPEGGGRAVESGQVGPVEVVRAACHEGERPARLAEPASPPHDEG